MKRPIVTLAERAAVGARALAAQYRKSNVDLEDAAKEKDALAAKIEANIARRKADPRFILDVTHVKGKGVLQARSRHIQMEAEKRARLSLRDSGEAITDDAVRALVAGDVVVAAAREEENRAWLNAGLEGDAAARIEELFALGGEDLLLQAATEVVVFQEIGADLGEG